ncbi:MAG: WG repeat-containing protein [Flavobacteriales bacterium]|nr:WG repeat-containing protein [Flavobacteriales bacterium]
MKTLFSLLFAVLANGQIFAQTPLAQAKAAGSSNWGYINTKGVYVIEAQFADCDAFSADGLAPIFDKKAKTSYFIKPNGEKLNTEVPKFRLKDVFGFGTLGFENGMCPVQVDKSWGYMSSDGKMAVPASYEKMQEFNGGYGVAAKGGKFFIIDKKGTEKAVEVAGVVDVRHFSDGFAPIKVGETWGFISTDGSVAIEPSFKSVGYFSEGLAWAKNAAGQTGFIDKKGAWVIEAKYENAKEFSNGMARVKSGTWIFVDKTGKTIDVPAADSFGDFCDGLAYCKSADKVGFIDKTGKLVIPQTYTAVRDFKNGFAAVKLGEKWGFIDTKGNLVIEAQFDAVKDFELTAR